jgi:hypothetical protein
MESCGGVTGSDTCEMMMDSVVLWVPQYVEDKQESDISGRRCQLTEVAVNNKEITTLKQFDDATVATTIFHCFDDIMVTMILMPML